MKSPRDRTSAPRKWNLKLAASCGAAIGLLVVLIAFSIAKDLEYKTSLPVAIGFVLINAVLFALAAIIRNYFIEAKIQKSNPNTWAVFGALFIVLWIVVIFLNEITYLYESMIEALSAEEEVIAKEIEEDFLTSPLGKPLRTIRQNDPERYRALMQTLVGIASSDNNNKREKARRVLLQYKRSLAEDAASAPDGLIRSMLREVINLYEALRSEPTLCAQVAAHGGSALSGAFGDQYLELLSKVMNSTLMALYKSQDTEHSAPLSTEEDWASLGEYWADRGATQVYFDTIANPSPSDPKLCEVQLSLMNAMHDMPGETGERIRASFFLNYASK